MMNENSTNDTRDTDGEVSAAINNLSLDATTEPADKADSTHPPESSNKSELAASASGADANGADEAKDSEATPPESKGQPVKGRVFVGGISWRTTDRDLREYFGKFGVIKDCLVCKDQWTGKSRGFGFLSFEDPQVAETLISKTHTIGGRTVQVKTAVPKSNNVPHPEAPKIPAGRSRTKLFVGGLHRGVTNKEFRTYFEAYGKLTDAFIMYNSQSKRSRGFGFITFVSQEAAHQCLRERHTIRGKAVELKVAIPREIIGSTRDKRKFRNGRHGQQPQQQHPQQHVKYDGVWPAELHSNTGAMPYGHLVPGAPMMTPPILPTGSEAPPLASVTHQHNTPPPVNPHVGVYDQWMPSVMGVGRPTAGVAAGIYSQDVYYGSMGPPHGLATNPYGFGYHMPMYTPYGEIPMAYDPGAPMYDTGSGFPMPHPSVSTLVAAPASIILSPPPNTVAPNVVPPHTENPTIVTPAVEYHGNVTL